MAPRIRRTRRTDVPRIDKDIQHIHEEVVRDGDIAQRAYELFLSRGGTHGHDFDDWIQAKRELVREPQGGDKLG
jgi:hypothetical protein